MASHLSGAVPTNENGGRQGSLLPMLRLLQIVSQGSPTGAFSYSQGLEWAVQVGWIHDRCTFESWLREQLQGTLARQELPLMLRLYDAYANGDSEQAIQLAATVLSFRETSELRDEERKRGQAMARLATQLNSAVTCDTSKNSNPYHCQLSVFAEYCAIESIPPREAMQGYAFAWLESQVMAGVKLVPLGQTDGQQVLYKLAEMIDQCVVLAWTVPDADIGYSSPALAMASSQHETQYSRLFRS